MFSRKSNTRPALVHMRTPGVPNVGKTGRLAGLEPGSLAGPVIRDHLE
jgi:hypothetical protein